MLPTREYEDGAWVTRTAPFRVYHNIAESIEDHSRLLATSPAYQHAMASRGLPDAFATALTGVYATDPGYGSNLIALMRLYNLYRYDPATPGEAAGVTGGTPVAGASAGSGVASQQAVVPGVPDEGGPAGGAPADGAGIPGVAGALAVGAVRVRARRRGPEPERSAPEPEWRAPETIGADRSRIGADRSRSGGWCPGSGRGSGNGRDLGNGRGRGSRRGVRCRSRAATSRGFRTRSPPTSRLRLRSR